MDGWRWVRLGRNHYTRSEIETRVAVACVSYTPEGDQARLIAVSGDVFEIGRKQVKPLHADLKDWKTYERDVKKAPANAVTEEELRRTAEIVLSVPYRERRKAVADELGVQPAVAKARIATGRRKGYLTEEASDAQAAGRQRRQTVRRN